MSVGRRGLTASGVALAVLAASVQFGPALAGDR